MLEKEAVESVKIGTTIIITAAFLLLILYVTVKSNQWYSALDSRQSTEEAMQTEADAFIMENGSVVSGDDIVEFIIRNDALYDYYIVIDGRTYQITRARAEALYLEGKNGGIIWSEDYLTNTVFGNFIYDYYIPAPYKENDVTVSYTFKKE